MNKEITPLLRKFITFAKDRMKFEHPPRLFLRQDSKNGKCVLGKTAHYNPQEKSITLYITNRHPKDILRSFAHELIHHCQCERGDLEPEKMKSMNQKYAQENDHMRKMEEEAYLQGNMCFRDWEDGLDDKLQYKMKIAEQRFLKESKEMTVKITKKELKNLIEKLLSERSDNELDEAGCGSHGSRDDGKESSKKDCNNCKGEGCEHCEEKDKSLEEGESGKLYARGESGCCDQCAGKDSPHLGDKSVEEGSKPKPMGAGPDGKKDTEDDLPAWLPQKEEEVTSESKIRTPEQENTLYESRFTKKNTRLFEKLLKEWAK